VQRLAIQVEAIVHVDRSRLIAHRAACTGAASVAACIAVLTFSRSAHAQTYDDRYYVDRERSAFDLGFDLEGAAPINIPQVNGNQVNGGGGFKIRVGEQLRFPGIRFIPELGYGYDHLFATDDSGDSYAWDLHRVFGGARLAFGHLIVPVIYGHIGYGWRATGEPEVPSVGGLAYDVGAALDLHLIPHFAFGAHFEYGSIDTQPYTPQWLAMGLHADVTF
jgi:hypothetical protein